MKMIKEEFDLQRWKKTYTVLSVILIAILFTTAAIGLFGKNIYDAFSPAKYVQESRAQDLITLVLGIPFLITSLIAVRKEMAWGFPLWTGVLAYELYVYAIYVLGGVYNPLFCAYTAIASLSLYTMIGLLCSIDKNWFALKINEKMPRKGFAFFFVVITIVFAFIWIMQVIQSINSGVQDSGHLIFVIDLMIVLPAFAITSLKLFQKKTIGDLLAGFLLIKFDSLCISIVLGQVFRGANGITVEGQLLSVFISLGLISMILTFLYFRAFVITHKEQV